MQALVTQIFTDDTSFIDLLCQYLIVADYWSIDLQYAMPFHYLYAVLVSKYILYNQVTSLI